MTKWLASGSSDNTVRLWQIPSGTEALVLHGHTGSVNGVSFTPDGMWLASCSPDETVRLWQIPAGVCLQVISVWYKILNITFSNKEKALAVSGRDGNLSLLSFANNNAVQWRLNWTHKPSVLTLDKLNIAQTIGLSDIDKRLCEQRGAIGQPAPATQRYRALYELFQPIAETATQNKWCDSLWSGINTARHVSISEDRWCISIARDDSDKANPRVSLVIEGIKKCCRFIIKAELRISKKGKVIIDLKALGEKSCALIYFFRIQTVRKSYQLLML